MTFSLSDSLSSLRQPAAAAATVAVRVRSRALLKQPALSDLLDRNNFLIYVSSLYAFCLNLSWALVVWDVAVAVVVRWSLRWFLASGDLLGLLFSIKLAW